MGESKLNSALVSGRAEPGANGAKPQVTSTIDQSERPLQNTCQRRATTGGEWKFSTCKQRVSATSRDLDTMELFTLDTRSRLRSLKEDESKLNSALVSGRAKPGAKPQVTSTIDQSERP